MSNRQTEGGYRGALPPRQDRLAAPWVVVVVAIFLLMIVLSFVGLPSAFFPEATPSPLPSVAASASASPAASGSSAPSGSAQASSSAAGGSAAPSASASP